MSHCCCAATAAEDLSMSNRSSDICFACQVALPENGPVMSCCDCEYEYHLGACSGIRDATFKTMNDASKQNWRCTTCKTTKARGSQSRKKKGDQDSDITEELAEINRKLSEFLSIHEKVEALMGIRDTVLGIEHSIQLMSDKYDDLLSQIKSQGKDITDLKKRVKQVEENNSADEIKKLREELNDLQQYSRRQNLEVHNVPYVEGENLLDRLNTMADELNLTHLDETNVEAIHRLPAKPNKAPPILVRFTSRVTREKWLEKRAQLRERKSKEYLMENLTAQNKRLLWLIKRKAEEMDYQFAWQKNGKMFVRKRPQDRVIRIQGEEDLAKIR